MEKGDTRWLGGGGGIGVEFLVSQTHKDVDDWSKWFLDVCLLVFYFAVPR